MYIHALIIYNSLECQRGGDSIKKYLNFYKYLQYNIPQFYILHNFYGVEILNCYLPKFKSEKRKFSVQFRVTKLLKHLSKFIAEGLCLLTMYKHSLLLVIESDNDSDSGIVKLCCQNRRRILTSVIYLQMKVLLRKPLSGEPPREDTSHPEILTGRQLAT